MPSQRGRLLVASPSLLDPNFARTVVLVAEHSDEGAMGVVLNRPLEVSAVDAAPALAGVVSEGPVYAGGPVQPQGVIVLADFADLAAAAFTVSGSLGFVGADADLDTLGAAVRRARIFAGHAGWGSGQLDAELEDEGWITVDLRPGDPFTDDPHGLWSVVLARQGGSYALLARMPADPSLN